MQDQWALKHADGPHDQPRLPFSSNVKKPLHLCLICQVRDKKFASLAGNKPVELYVEIRPLVPRYDKLTMVDVDIMNTSHAKGTETVGPHT